MNTFKKYLEAQGYYSREKMSLSGRHYQTWLDKEKIAIEVTEYKDVLNYVGYLQKQGKKVSSINDHLCAIDHYYRYKGLPAVSQSVRIKSSKAEKLPFFKKEELDIIYNHYKSTSKAYYKYSDKLILSLVIYQGIERHELLNLELNHIKLETGRIYIPGGRANKNGRELNLESHQIIPMYHYIQNHREAKGEKLFSRQSETLAKLARQLKKLYRQVKIQSEELSYEVIRLNQLRQSRLAIWVKEDGLRKAQYKAGFKQVSTVQEYETEELENLQEQINKYHPLQ